MPPDSPGLGSIIWGVAKGFSLQKYQGIKLHGIFGIYTTFKPQSSEVWSKKGQGTYSANFLLPLFSGCIYTRNILRLIHITLHIISNHQF